MAEKHNETQPPTIPPTPPTPPEDKSAPAWKPRKGGPCSVVYMTGGPVFVETTGKILELNPDGTAKVQFATPKGKTSTFDAAEFIERGGPWSRVGFTSPA